MLGKLLKAFSLDKKALILIIIGSLIWSLTMFKSGLVYSYGVGFWGPNGHDGVWHIALSENLAKGSWEMPVFAGEAVKNYHIGFDLILAFIHKLTFIPIHTLYFQVIPPILASLIGIFAYKFVYVWRKSAKEAFWATFFVYFGGNWGWVVSLLRDKNFNGESMFWSQQSISTLVNPPFAFSLVLIFAGLYYLVKGSRLPKIQSNRYFLLSTFLFGILVQVKVYAGILILAALFMAGIWRMIKRKGVSLIKVFTGSLILSILIFSPVSKDVENSIVFSPFWFLETMMSFTDRVGWQKFGEAMMNYKLAENFIKGIPAYIIAFSIFWFGNLGTRIIKEIQFLTHFKNFRKLNYLEIFIYTIIGLGVAIPTLVIQKGTPWNTIQFMYYSLMFSGILAGISLGEFIDRNLMTRMILVRTIMVLIVLLTIPTTIGTLKHYLPSRPPAKISNAELEALDFLAKQPDGVVLTQPYDKDKADTAIDNPPRPLYLYESTAYVSAFSQKPLFLEDEVNLEITGYEWKTRRKMVENFLENPSWEFLIHNNIKYIYARKDGKTTKFDSVGADKIFENNEVIILKV